MNNEKAHQPIAIFDSGVGGLTVARAIRALLPHEPILYLADTLSRPFGTKSPEELHRILERNIQLLLSYPIKMLVIACHTACSCGFKMFKDLPIPVMTIFPTSLDLLFETPKLTSLLVLGTHRTINAHIYQDFIQKHFPHISAHFIGSSPLEQLIEEQCKDPVLIEATLKTLLAPLQGQPVQAAFLACTHFPIYKYFIQNILTPSTYIIDPALHFSKTIYHTLQTQNLLNPSTTPPTDQYLITGDILIFKAKFLCYFGETLGKTTTCFNHPYATL